jgi:hypothetical protein
VGEIIIQNIYHLTGYSEQLQECSLADGESEFISWWEGWGGGGVFTAESTGKRNAGWQ